MDRRSWLWRRKSSDKSPGETESSGSGSGSVSISSPSERFSDDQLAYSNQSRQSPEVTSKAAPQEEDVNDSVKILAEKLSAALANVSAKEELAQQHAKVAEEAVTGWEKAEEEVITLKHQLDAATKKNLSLEDRIVHLDGALKECLRQLRQVREEQNQKIRELILKKSPDSESKSSELETQLGDLRAQLESANAKAETAASLECDLRLRLESAEKENASLQLKIRSLSEQLEIRTLERDLSTKTAETASKQHLESIKKVAKLEAECRRLKSMARKPTPVKGQRSFNASPSHVCKSPMRSSVTASDDIGLMDDFLEMERLAALPVEEDTTTKKLGGNGEASLNIELEEMKNRTAELEKKIEMLDVEKVDLGNVLIKRQDELKLSAASLAQLQTQFNECQNQLKISQSQLRDADNKLSMLQSELDLATDLRQAIELELEDANVRKEEAESRLKAIEDESKILLSKVGLFEGEAQKERALYVEASAKCRALEEEVSKMKCEAETWQSQSASMSELKEALERELQSTNAKKEEAESQLTAAQAEVKFLLAKVDTLENEAEKERQWSAELSTKCRRLEEELSGMKHEAGTLQSKLTSAINSNKAVERELEMTNTKKEGVESQLKAAEAEAKSLLAKVGSLEHEVEKERALSAGFSSKCKKLEDELSKMKSSAEFRLAPISKEELNNQQEMELALAASKLAECQKTIASLGKTLKSLANFDDLFLDSDKLLEVSDKESQLPKNCVELTNLSSSNTVLMESRAFALETIRDSSDMRDSREPKKDSKQGLSSTMLDKSQRNGFGKLFPRSKSAMRSR